MHMHMHMHMHTREEIRLCFVPDLRIRAAARTASSAADAPMPPRRDFPMLGGRRLKPAFDPISEDEPTADDLRWSDKLWNYMQEASPQESIAEQQKRSTVMGEITTLFKAWVTSVCESKGVPHELAIKAGGQVLTSGSYRLGINEKGMDIDTICVAPQPVTREDFFGSLQAILEDHDSVENLSSIPGAAVPIITFDYDGINIDLLFALLPLDAVPEDFDVNFDDVLRGCDQGTEKSLNGPRVTEMLTKVCHTGPEPQASRPQAADLRQQPCYSHVRAPPWAARAQVRLLPRRRALHPPMG